MIRTTPASPSPRARSTDDRVVYAIGDVHGCYDLLTALLEAVVVDVASIANGASPMLVFCGDYIDRGLRSFDVLSTMVWLTRQAAMEVVCLRGNHEAMLLDFLRHPTRNLPWLRRDGISTLRAYGVDVDSGVELGDADSRRLRGELMDRMPASHLAFLQNLPTRVTCGDYVFVHAGLRPGVPVAQQIDEDCLWIGEEFLTHDKAFEKIVVHGHSWNSNEPEVRPYRIGLDTGAYSTGVLTAVRLDGAAVEFIQAQYGSMEPLQSGWSQAGFGSGGR